MCGIVGYVGDGQASDFLLEGLAKLEYRGYDSAGIAVASTPGSMRVVRRMGKVAGLAERVNEMSLDGGCGIGHTRWATHGQPSEENAHPHVDCTGKIALVHNGIIENYIELRERLIDEGHVFKSQTDTETVAHLIESYYEGDLLSAVRAAMTQVVGSYALVVICDDDPDQIVVTRKDSPIVIGSTAGAALVASDVIALINYTREVVIMQDRQFAVMHKSGSIDYFDESGDAIHPQITQVDWDIDASDKGAYPDYMMKEIYEQPRVVRDTLAGRVIDGQLSLDELKLSYDELDAVDRVYIIACGTSYHAGLIAKYLVESWSRIPCEVEAASEFRYRNPIITPSTLVVAVSQSGETADTLAAIRDARIKGAKVFGITNVVGSSVARESDGVIYIKAKNEVSVAATKSFLGQVVALTLLAMLLGQSKGKLTSSHIKMFYRELADTAEQIEAILSDTSAIDEAAHACINANSALFIGRGVGATICYEGALKLKEISYLHAEAYAAGEMKHGPIALLEEGFPVVVVATQSPTYDKVISNIQEVKARGAMVIAVATEGDTAIQDQADYVIYIPPVRDAFSAITASVPLQLFAHSIAVARGCDVDRPRNLAKSVTVE